jgi:hypothetical protein
VHTQGHLHWSQQLHTHTLLLMPTQHSHPGKDSHIFLTTPSLSTGLSCTYRARTGSKVRSAFWGQLVHTQGHLHWSQQLHPHISADALTSPTPREAMTHFSNTPFPFNRPGYWAHTCGEFGLLSGATRVHAQGHLHWSQQLHPHISADVHTSLTPREALTHFSNQPFPFNRPVLYVEGTDG